MTKRRDIIKALKASGFISKGGANHEKWIHKDGRMTIVGHHKDIPQPIARLTAKQVGVKLPQ